MKKASQSENKQCSSRHSQMVRRPNRFRRPVMQVSPWANQLPPELLSNIASIGPFTLRYITLHRVCREWRRSLTDYSPWPPLPSPQIPFLLVPHRDNILNSPLGDIFTLPFRRPHRPPRTYSLPQLEQTKGWICVGSSHGWLITLGLDSTISLLNPVTRDSFRLPPLSSIDNAVLSFHSGWYMYHLPQHNIFCSQFCIINRAVLSSDPAKDPGFTVLLFFYGMNDRCYTYTCTKDNNTRRQHLHEPTCTKDNNTWRQHLHEPFLVEDVIFFNGVFVAVDPSTNIGIFDFMNLDTGLVMKHQKAIFWMPPDKAFLVNSAGKLLLFVKCITANWNRFPRGSFQMFEIVMPDSVRMVPSLSQCSLFVGPGCSISVSTQLFPWLPEGRVYFPYVYSNKGKNKAGGEITLHCAGVYEFSFESGTTRQVFAVDYRRFAPLWTFLRFFWVTPNLNRK